MQTFQSIVGQFKSKTDFERHFSECERKFDLKVYRVGTLTRQQALQSYTQLWNKYEKGVYSRMPTGWYENERRLFVWFVVCYGKFHKVSEKNQEVWEELARIFFQKDVRLLKYQFMNILKRTGRVQWTQEEDTVIANAVSRHQIGEWNEIAKDLYFSGASSQFKTAKHCRERWNNHLNNEIKKDPWTEEEDLQILMKIQQRGKKWSLIAKQLGNRRTEHQIKNRWNSLYQQFIKNNNISQKLIQQEVLTALLKSKQTRQTKKQPTSQQPPSQFSFLNTINVIQESSQPRSSQSHYPILLKPSFQSNQSHEDKKEYTTSGGMTLVYCGNKSNMLDKSLTVAIEDKLFGNSSLWMSECKDGAWWEGRVTHTPGGFFEDSSQYEKKMSQFKLSQKGSMEKSDIAASMEFLKLPRSDMSQQYRFLTSSTSHDPKAKSMNYEFSNDIKQL